MTSEEFAIVFKCLLWIAGIIITIGGAATVISRWIMPWKKMKEELKGKVNNSDFESLKNEVAELKTYQSSDHQELTKIETGIEKTCKCILAITDHELTGNSVDKLREAKDEMQDYLIKK